MAQKDGLVNAGGAKWGEFSKALTDANTTLAQSEYENRFIEFTGALTAGRDLILPATEGQEWDLLNSTTGGFALTVKVSGSTGVSLPAGYRGRFFYDGTDIRRAAAMLPTTPQTYAISNVTTDRTADANATTLDEVIDVLGTLIADLRAQGIVL